MTTIVNIDSQKFSIDGIKYYKNFMSVVFQDKLKIVNIYDSRLCLSELKDYTEYSVNGVVHSSVANLQNALLPVLYTRDSLGSGSGGGGSASPISFGELRLKAKGDGNVDPQLEIGDIVEGFKDATTYWSAAVYNGGDATDRANYTPLVEISLT